MRTFPLSAAAILVAVSLAGCGSVAEASYLGVPQNPLKPTQQGLIDGTPTVTWLSDETRFAITLAGSSNCSSYPSKVSQIDDHTIEVVTQRTKRPLCTADFILTTYELSTPAGIDESLPVVVVLGENSYELGPR